MPNEPFSCPIEVRYGDLDPQGHVNNAKFLTYFEQARINYFVNLGLLNKTQAFINVGIIVADVHVTFLAPVLFGYEVCVGVQVTRLGNKSLTVTYRMFETGSGVELATGSTVLVTFDYHKNETVPIPDRWREKISAFEGLDQNEINT
jgi:acyl-CoA thioester hydrolase